jgi:hypothetical protein
MQVFYFYGALFLPRICFLPGYRLGRTGHERKYRLISTGGPCAVAGGFFVYEIRP